jgi:hypothetical protein
MSAHPRTCCIVVQVSRGEIPQVTVVGRTTHGCIPWSTEAKSSGRRLYGFRQCARRRRGRRNLGKAESRYDVFPIISRVEGSLGWAPAHCGPPISATSSHRAADGGQVKGFGGAAPRRLGATYWVNKAQKTARPGASCYGSWPNMAR